MNGRAAKLTGVAPPLRVFLQTPDPVLATRLAADAARAGWVVVAREDDADIVIGAAGPAASGGAPARPAPARPADDTDAPVESLTPRELDVLRLLADGAGNRAIAERLGISDHTVKFHLSAIFGKLGVATRTAAVRRALRLGWIDA